MQEIKYKVQYIDINKLKIHPENPRFIKDEDFETLCTSIQDNPEYFETRPVICDTKFVIWAGNMRYRGAKHLGWKQVPTVVLDLPEEKLREIMIRDNVQSGQWDIGLLSSLYENEELEKWGVDLSQFGVSPTEIEPNEADDAIPEAVGEGSVAVGDIYLLGKHRVMCGDSTKLEDMEKLMNGTKADMVFTDPPYLMGFTGNVHGDGSKSHNAKFGAIKNDKMSTEDGKKFVAGIIQNMKLNCIGAFYVCFYRLGMHYIFNALHDNDIEYKAVIIWDKGNHTLSNSDYMSKYEPIIYGWISEHNFYGGRSNFDIWEIPRTSKNELHPTMKPVDLCANAIVNSSKKQDIVLDMFLGSGSTLIASEKMGRICYGMELDPKYVAVIIKRWEEYTKGKAVKL